MPGNERLEISACFCFPSTSSVESLGGIPSHSTFSPDGRWLAASGAKSFGVGDLAAARQQLRELGMDWSEETAAHPR